MRLLPSLQNREGPTVKPYPKRKVEVQGAATANRFWEKPYWWMSLFGHVPKLVRNSVIYLFIWHSQYHVHQCLLITYIYNTSATYLQLQSFVIRLSTPNSWFGSMFLHFQGIHHFCQIPAIFFSGVYICFPRFTPGARCVFLQRWDVTPMTVVQTPDSRLSVAASRFRRPGIVNFKAILRPAEPRRFFFGRKKWLRKWPFVQLIPTSKWMDLGGWLQMNNIYIYMYICIPHSSI